MPWRASRRPCPTGKPKFSFDSVSLTGDLTVEPAIFSFFFMMITRINMLTRLLQGACPILAPITALKS